MLAALLSLVVWGCKDREPSTDAPVAPPSLSTETAEVVTDNARATQQVNSSMGYVEAVYAEEDMVARVASSAQVGPCGANYTHDTTSRIIIIDFGQGTQCNGVTYTGQIITQYNGTPKAPGFSITVQYQNFTINGERLEGGFTMFYEGKDSAGRPMWVIDNIVNGQRVPLRFVFKDSSALRWDYYMFTIVKTQGYMTVMDETDDAYAVTDTINGVSRRNVQFTMVSKSSNPLQKMWMCRFPHAGELIMTFFKDPQNPDEIVVNFDPDNRACDGKVSVSVNGSSPVVLNIQ